MHTPAGNVHLKAPFWQATVTCVVHSGRVAEGLTPQTTRVRFSGEQRIVVDGPFTETKEIVAGFSIITVKSKEEAIEWVKRAPNVSPTGEGVVEIRKLMDVEDFGENFTPNEEIAKVKF